MTDLDTVLMQLFVAKQRLRRLRDAIEDARKAAKEPAGEFSPASYLSIAGALDAEAEELSEKFAELESIRAKLK